MHEAEQTITAARTLHDEAVAAEKARRQELALAPPLAASAVSLTNCMQALKEMLPPAAQTAFGTLCLALAVYSPDDVEMTDALEPPQDDLPSEAPPVPASAPPEEASPPKASPAQAPCSIALARVDRPLSLPPNAKEAADAGSPADAALDQAAQPAPTSVQTHSLSEGFRALGPRLRPLPL